MLDGMTLGKDAGSSPGYFHSPLLQPRSGLHSEDVTHQCDVYNEDQVSIELSQRLASRGDGRRRHVPTSPAGSSFATPSRISSGMDQQGSPSLRYSVKSKFGTNFSERLVLKRQGGSEQELAAHLHSQVKDSGKRYTPTFGGARKFHAMRVQEHWKKSGSYSRSSTTPPSHSLSEVGHTMIQSKGREDMSESGEGVGEGAGAESVGEIGKSNSISDRASVVSGTSAVSFLRHSHPKPGWKPSQESMGIARVKGIGLLRGQGSVKNERDEKKWVPMAQEKSVTGTSSRTMEHILLQFPKNKRQSIEKEEALKCLVTAKELRKELKNIVSIPVSSHVAVSVDEEIETSTMIDNADKGEMLAQLAHLKSEALTRYQTADESIKTVQDKPGKLDVSLGESSQEGGLPSPEIAERLDRIKLLNENADKLWKQKSASERN